jgi:Tol biopolymer transport system component
MPAPDASTVRAELDRILASPAFAKSPRMTRFLKFVVEETLAGNSDRIKESIVAIEVFDKTPQFDPQSDSTVRTEAGKLRSRLSRYYETHGQNGAVVISIPKGTYVPIFENWNVVPASQPHGRRLFRVGVVFLAAASCIVISGLLWRASRSPAPEPRLTPLTSDSEIEAHPSLSPDGSQVAYRWKGDIWVRQVDGESLTQITKSPAVDDWPSWSPDGRNLAFVRDGSVLIIPALGGSERKVTESLGSVLWAPNGSALFVMLKTSAYARSIFVVSLSTGEKRRLTFPHDRSPGEVDMAVSPDGRTLAFSREAVRRDLYVVPTAGGEAQRLTNDNRGLLGMAWTPDGREVVFSSNRRGWFRLWRVPAAPPIAPGEFPTPRLVEGAGDDASYPAFPSKRGTALLVYQKFSRNFDIRRAEVIGPEGTARHHLKPSTPLISSTRLDVTPSWSPDGTTIAFKSNRSGAEEVWICAADAGNPIKLTSFAGPEVTYPRWSPDGRRLVFGAYTGPNGNFESYTINAAGGTPQLIRRSGGLSMAHPVFSHDGRWLYFIPGPLEDSVEVWRMPSTGGEATKLTSNGAIRPEESPDGKLVYYGKVGTPGLWSTPVTGGQERRIPVSVAQANWTVTSKGIYYFDFAVAPGEPKLVKFYSFQTGEVNRVGTVEATVSGDYSGISVSPNGRWLLYSYVANAASDLMLVDHFR